MCKKVQKLENFFKSVQFFEIFNLVCLKIPILDPVYRRE